MRFPLLYYWVNRLVTWDNLVFILSISLRKQPVNFLYVSAVLYVSSIAAEDGRKFARTCSAWKQVGEVDINRLITKENALDKHHNITVSSVVTREARMMLGNKAKERLLYRQQHMTGNNTQWTIRPTNSHRPPIISMLPLTPRPLPQPNHLSPHL